MVFIPIYVDVCKFDKFIQWYIFEYKDDYQCHLNEVISNWLCIYDFLLWKKFKLPTSLFCTQHMYQATIWWHFFCSLFINNITLWENIHQYQKIKSKTTDKLRHDYVVWWRVHSFIWSTLLTKIMLGRFCQDPIKYYPKENFNYLINTSI